MPRICDTIPLNFCVPCARFTWHNCPETPVCLMPGLRDNYSPKTSLYRVPGLHDTIAHNVCLPCVRFTWQYFPSDVCVPWARLTWRYCRKTSVWRVRDLRDNISPKASLCCEPGKRDKIALKRLFAVCQIYVTILPLQHVGTVWQVYMTQLP